MAIRDLRARVILTANTTGLSRGFREADKSVSGFGDTLGQLKALVIGGGAVAAAIKGFDELQEAANLAAQEEALRRSLTNIGIGFDDFILKLQQASNSTVSTAALIQSSSRALLLGIPAEQIADLLEVARTRAIATGIDVEQAFNDITTGIGRLSPLILDNLGFTINLTAAYEDYAEAVGKSVEELSKQEQQQAVTNKILKQGAEDTELFGDAADGAATSTQQFTAALADLRTSLGEIAAEAAGDSGVFERLALDLRRLTGVLEGNEEATTQVQRNLAKTALEALGLNRTLVNTILNLSTTRDGLLFLTENFDKLEKVEQEVNEETERFNRNLATLESSGLTTFEALAILIQAENDLAATTDEAGDKTDELGDSTEKLKEDLNNLTDAVDETADSEDALTLSTDNATAASLRLEEQSRRTRDELARTAEQARVTAAAFDAIDQQFGREAAVQAALAGGGELILGGTRINLPGGGSRLVRPAGGLLGTSRRRSRFFPELTSRV